jgi:hypothetical protein
MVLITLFVCLVVVVRVPELLALRAETAERRSA